MTDHWQSAADFHSHTDVFSGSHSALKEKEWLFPVMKERAALSCWDSLKDFFFFFSEMTFHFSFFPFFSFLGLTAYRLYRKRRSPA